MTTYYDAPEPDDLQRRCWIIDDGQCRLYNGHEGGHDFGGATGVRHGRHCPCSACAREDWTNPDLAACDYHPGVHCAYDPAVLATPDRADLREVVQRAVNHLSAGEDTAAHVILVEALATPDPRLRSDGPEPDRADPERGGMLTTERERDAYLEGHAKGVEDARRADPERRAEGLLAEAASIIETGDQRLLASDGPAGGQPPDLSLAEWRRLYVVITEARAALTPPPAGKAVLGSTTANEIEEGK